MLDFINGKKSKVSLLISGLIFGTSAAFFASTVGAMGYEPGILNILVIFVLAAVGTLLILPFSLAIAFFTKKPHLTVGVANWLLLINAVLILLPALIKPV